MFELVKLWALVEMLGILALPVTVARKLPVPQTATEPVRTQDTIKK